MKPFEPYYPSPAAWYLWRDHCDPGSRVNLTALPLMALPLGPGTAWGCKMVLLTTTFINSQVPALHKGKHSEDPKPKRDANTEHNNKRRVCNFLCSICRGSEWIQCWWPSFSFTAHENIMLWIRPQTALPITAFSSQLRASRWLLTLHSLVPPAVWTV